MDVIIWNYRILDLILLLIEEKNHPFIITKNKRIILVHIMDKYNEL